MCLWLSFLVTVRIICRLWGQKWTLKTVIFLFSVMCKFSCKCDGWWRKRCLCSYEWLGPGETCASRRACWVCSVTKEWNSVLDFKSWIAFLEGGFYDYGLASGSDQQTLTSRRTFHASALKELYVMVWNTRGTLQTVNIRKIILFRLQRRHWSLQLYTQRKELWN